MVSPDPAYRSFAAKFKRVSPNAPESEISAAFAKHQKHSLITSHQIKAKRRHRTTRIR